jgi:hypothetical protein
LVWLAVLAGGVLLAWRLMEGFRLRQEWTNNPVAALAAALAAPLAIFVGTAMLFRSIPARRRSAAAPSDRGRDPSPPPA